MAARYSRDPNDPEFISSRIAAQEPTYAW